MKQSFPVQSPEEMVRDVFLCGVLNSDLQERFYTQGKDLTVETMLEIAHDFETSGCSVKEEKGDNLMIVNEVYFQCCPFLSLCQRSSFFCGVYFTSMAVFLLQLFIIFWSRSLRIF